MADNKIPKITTTVHMSIKQLEDCEIETVASSSKQSFSLKRFNNLIGSYILVGFVTKSVLKTYQGNDDAPTNSVGIHIRDGTGTHSITSYSHAAEDFTIGDYYQFLVRLSYRPASGDKSEFRGSILLGCHKIEDFNEVSYHLAASVNSFAYDLDPNFMEYLKILTAYVKAPSKPTLKSNTIDIFLSQHPQLQDDIRQSFNINPNANLLTELKNFLKVKNLLKIGNGEERLTQELSTTSQLE